MPARPCWNCPPARTGLEFQRLESRVDLTEDRSLRLVPQRWIDMAARNWWSADFHIHRPPDNVPLLLCAEDLNLGVVFTMWNKRNLWEGNPIRGFRAARGPAHLATLMNAEDERGGGASPTARPSSSPESARKSG